jgi:TatD DNase family protein
MFDIAVNLADSQLRYQADQVLQDARDAGVEHCLLIGTDIEESQWLADRAEAWSLPFTAGIHPHYVAETEAQAESDWQAKLAELIRHPLCAAVGETGLDWFRMLSPRDTQVKMCEQQLAMAEEADKPVYLHDRDASNDLYALVKNFPGIRGVVHCFTGDQAALEAYLDLGLSIGITAWCLDERRGQTLAELVHLIPDDRLMIETDAPYLVPRTLRPRPKRNEPKFLPHIIEGIAALRGQTSEQLKQVTCDNAKRLFDVA